MGSKNNRIFSPSLVLPCKGRVLFSYLAQPMLWEEIDPKFLGHSNCWESREIVRIFNEFGFDVDCIDWTDNSWFCDNDYDIFFDIADNLQRFAPFAQPGSLKILHLTGSYHEFQQAAELQRVADLERRSGMLYSPKRLPSNCPLSERSLRLADYCPLIGNQKTLETYPAMYRNKITLVPVSASHVSFIKSPREYASTPREFLFFTGVGAVHKGLDRVLEVFANNPQFRLNIVGDFAGEKDFVHIYQKELFTCPNIHYHGYLPPSGDVFINIVKRSFCFIAPSCSEGISSSVVTCLQLGLYPIISKQNGVDLPDKCGTFLDSCSIEEIAQVVRDVYNLSDLELVRQIGTCQELALKKYSREQFREKMVAFLAHVLHEHAKNAQGVSRDKSLEKEARQKGLFAKNQ